MSQQGPAKRGKLADFRRACRFLYPHRRLVAVSVLCALVVGVAFTCSLGTMLPVFNVLLSGESAQTWIDRSIAQKRISARLSPDNDWTALANPAARQALAKDADGKLVNVELEAVPWYLRAGRDLVGILPASPVAAVAWVLGFIALLTVFGNVVRFFQEYLSEKAAVLAVNDLRRKLYNHALHLPLSFFSLKGTSDVTSRLTQEAHVLQEGLKSVLGQSVQEPIKAAMAFALAMIASWKLTLFICIFAPLGVLVIRKFGKKMRRASRVMLQESAAMLGQIESSLAGIRVVKASTAERFERRQYGKVMDGLIDQQLRMSRIDAMNTPALETVNMLVVSAVVLYAAYLVVVAQTLAAGTFMLVMACLIGIGESLRRVGKINNVLQKSNSSAARMFEILDVPTEADRGSADSGLPAPNEQSAISNQQSAIQNPKSKIQNPNSPPSIRRASGVSWGPRPCTCAA
jgi:subfamily B ATP-binding cassette protein MsbA